MRDAKLLCCAAAILAGCSSAPKVTNVTDAGEQTIEGIPFRIKTEHTVRIWALQEDDTYKEVSVTQAVAADMSRLYAIDVRSYPFASPTLKATYNSDNTLKLVNVRSTNNAGPGIDAINSATAGLLKAQTDKSAAKVAASGVIATAERNVRDAQDTFDKLPTTASAETRAIHERYVESAKRQANDAYAAAGLPRPYPDL